MKGGKEKTDEEKGREAVVRAKKMAEESHCQQCDSLMCGLNEDED